MSGSSLPLLRLLQVTDSSFPVGGYAYSHGLEWLVSTRRVVDLAGVEAFTRSVASTVARRQWLPAAAVAFRARTLAGTLVADGALDASISATAEREAGRAMGRRLLDVLAESDPSPGVLALQRAVDADETPGQFAVAFGVAGREAGASEVETLSALGFTLVNSVPQAAIRLGVIGPSGAARIIASAAPLLDEAVRTVTAERRPRPGTFGPMLEIAAMLQPTLRFRMFAS